MKELFTIGHSNHSSDQFIELLKQHGITAICDVRSHPYSRHNPQFNRENIQQELKRHDISYVFLGKELGPRSDDPGCYRNGKVQYQLLAQTRIFRQGLERLRKGMHAYRIALLCAEKDPIMCHRTILVCRHLKSEDVEIKHILEDGAIETIADSEKRLMRLLNIPQLQLFENTEELIERAYDIQSENIAYVEPADEHSYGNKGANDS
jgi:uncharacterized protein (DUF488 family)